MSEPIDLTRDLRHSISTLQAIVEACPLAMLVLDHAGIVRMWNRGAEQIFGWTEAEALGRPLPAAPELVADQLPFRIEAAREKEGGSHLGHRYGCGHPRRRARICFR